MKALSLALIALALASPAAFAKDSKAKQTSDAISDAWNNTKKLVSKKKKENCTETNGKTDCTTGTNKLKKSAKKATDSAKN